MGPMERLFSDRGRWRKAAACLSLAALLAGWFAAWRGSDRPSFGKIIREPDRWIGALVGPEYMQTLSSRPEEVLLEARFRAPIRIRIPAGAEGKEMRAAAAELEPSEWVSVAGIYLGDLTFDARKLEPEPYRKIKFAVSGAAAIAVVLGIAIRYRWSRGALRERARKSGAGGAS